MFDICTKGSARIVSHVNTFCGDFVGTTLRERQRPMTSCCALLSLGAASGRNWDRLRSVNCDMSRSTPDWMTSSTRISQLELQTRRAPTARVQSNKWRRLEEVPKCSSVSERKRLRGDVAVACPENPKGCSLEKILVQPK